MGVTIDQRETFLFPDAYLRNFSVQVFMHFGVSEPDARQAADVLAKSDLRGIDSHGVARLHTYFEMFKLGRINPKPKIKIIREKASVATVDGDNGLGLVVGPKANEIAMDKAEKYGSGWVSVCNTNHFGIAGYYPLKALERDLIGWAMTNSTKLVAPLWGAERMLGTNPIAIAFPGDKEPPIVIDMATSAVAYGKIEIALRKKEPVPKGWIIDKDGHDTTNPQDMIAGGAQLPLGSEREMGGHKGYGLASMVDILCCVLSGANWGPFAPPFALRQEIPERSVGKGIGHFFGAMQIDGFIDKAEFKKQIDDWIHVFRNTKPRRAPTARLSPATRKEKPKQSEAKMEFRCSNRW
jgi:LDH2 family malate/lactate/ureidoglycolate dehydrogenase